MRLPVAGPSQVDKLDPFSDSRLTHEYATLHGHRYHYLLAIPPSGHYTRTIFLLHGFPDLSFGWRYQVPLLLSLGLRVVVPDMMGYGRTDSPRVPPAPLADYSFKSAADAMAALAEHLRAGPIILGGHDWGGAVVYRTVLHHPGLVSHMFAVCTPYFPPSKKPYPAMEEVVKRAPNFRYWLQFASGEVQKAVNTEQAIRQFLHATYGGKAADGSSGMTTEHGVRLDVLDTISKSRLLDDREMEYYVQEYSRNGIDGPLNWYKTGEINWQDDRPLVDSPQIDIPALFIAASDDKALPEAASMGMERYMPQLTRRRVESGHWALWERPAEVNAHIEAFLKQSGALAQASKL